MTNRTHFFIQISFNQENYFWPPPPLLEIKKKIFFSNMMDSNRFCDSRKTIKPKTYAKILLPFTVLWRPSRYILSAY